MERNVLVLLLVACAAAHVVAQNSVQFVPGGCTLSVSASAQRGLDPWHISGTVTLSNANTFAVPITSVSVAVGNDIPVAPIFVTPDCNGAASVPQQGSITCTYTAKLPSNIGFGPSVNPAAWTGVHATVIIGMSGAQCSSPITPISGWLQNGNSAVAIASADATASAGGDASASATADAVAVGGNAFASADATATSGKRKLLQTVQFVPQGCSGLTVAATAQFSGNSIHGAVVLSNPNSFDIPITKVQVMLANNIPVAPMYVTANCGGASNVPFSPIPYQLGTLTCYFSAALPSSGPASSNSAWMGVRATATIGMSGATCPSPVAPINYLLMGRK